MKSEKKVNKTIENFEKKAKNDLKENFLIIFIG